MISAGRRRCRLLGGQIQILPACGQRRVLFGWADAALGGADRADLGAHGGAVGGIEAQHADRRVIAAGFQIRVQEAVSQLRLPVVQQVHEGKRGVADDVDPAQRRIEIDAVERHRLFADQRDIGQMQVAVAFAHMTVRMALRKKCGTGRKFGLGGGLQCGQAVGGLVILEQCRQLGKILQCRHAYRGGAAIGGVRRCGIRDYGGQVGVEAGQQRGQAVDVTRLHLVVRQQAVHLPGGGEAAHSDRIFDRRGGICCQQRLLRAAADRDHIQIQLRRQPAVQADFFGAVKPAVLQAAAIEKTQIQRLLDLVRIAPGQQYPGNVGFDHAHRLGRMRVAAGIAQRGNQLRLAGKIARWMVHFYSFPLFQPDWTMQGLGTVQK